MHAQSVFVRLLLWRGFVGLLAATSLAGLPVAAQSPSASPGLRELREKVRAQSFDEGLLAHVVFSSQVDGHYARGICQGARAVEPGPFAPLAALLEELGRHLARPHRPLLFDTGGMFAPHGVGRYATHEAPELVAEMLADLGYDALAFGVDDLAGAPDIVLAMAQALRAKGLPLIADNLHCRESAEALCAAIVSGDDGVSLHAQGRSRVALIAVMPADTLDQLPRDRSDALWLEPAAETIARKTRLARAQGAQVVIASIDYGVGTDATASALRLAQELPDDGRPDVLIAADAGRDLFFARPTTLKPAVAAAPPGGLSELRIRRQTLNNGAREVVNQPLHVPEAHSQVLDRFAAAVGPGYCRDWGVALPGGGLSRALDLEEMRRLSADAVRDATGAEVVVIPAALLHPEWRTERNALTLGDIFTAQRFADAVLMATVPASWVDALARQVEGQKGAETDVFAIGTQRLNDQTLVVGRPLDPDARYRVAVTRRALASGQLPPGPTWQRVRNLNTRLALRQLLQEPRSHDPRDEVYDPKDSVVWTLRANADGTFTGSKVDNPSAYTAAQLTTQDNVTLGFQSMVQADADHPDWGWANQFLSRYQTTRTAGAAAGVAKGADLISLQSNLEYRVWRKHLPRAYIPAPFIQSYLESEFVVPEERSWRHMLFRPTTGVRFTLTEELSVKLAVGGETQVLDPGARLRPGAGFEVVLRPWVLLRDDTRKVQLDGDVNYFMASMFGDPFQTLRGRFNASVDLAGPFALTLGLNVFAQRGGEQQDPLPPRWAAAIVGTAGLRIQWHNRFL